LFNRNVRSTVDLIGGKLDLLVYLNDKGKAKGFIYLSDGLTTNY